MLFQLKKALVWSMETTCGIKDVTLARTDKFMPEWVWDKDWWWLKWVYGCQLASISAELDERWNTGQWNVPSRREWSDDDI